MRPLLILTTLALTWPLVAAEKAMLTLSDGRVLEGARIVAIGEKTVSVSQAGSLFNLPVAEVPPATLARARTEIDERAAARKKAHEAYAPQATQQAAEAQAKRDEEIRLRLAAANMRAAAQGDAVVALPAGKPRTDPSAQLIAFKAQFPAKRIGKLNKSPGRVIEFDAPHVDAWSYYKGMVQTTTREALPRTLAMIETRMKQDADTFSKRVGDLRSEPRTADEAQARATIEWINRDLRPYLAKLRGVM